MRRRPQEGTKPAIAPIRHIKPIEGEGPSTGLVLSGGGARAAYQVGALKALSPFLESEGSKRHLKVVVGSSIGAINGLIVSACLKHGISHTIECLEQTWRVRNFRNTFTGSPSQAFFRAVKMAVLQYMAPGPNATSESIFDPTPLMQEVDKILSDNGGLSPDSRDPTLEAVAVMTTIEGAERKPLLFLSSHKPVPPENLGGASFEICSVRELHAKHGFASAALPSVLPPVELDVEGGRIRLVDGGISQNIPVDPAVRLGADRVIVIDVSGRDWWLDHYNEAHDTRPQWEVPAGFKTFCLRPPETFVSRCQNGLGKILRETVGRSRSKFMAALGPVWPVFTLIKNRLGEEVAFEAMTYVALDADYLHAIMESGYNETIHKIRKAGDVRFTRSESYDKWASEL